MPLSIHSPLLPWSLTRLFAWAGSRAEDTDGERGGEMREWGEGKEEAFASRSFEPKGQNMWGNNIKKKVQYQVQVKSYNTVCPLQILLHCYYICFNFLSTKLQLKIVRRDVKWENPRKKTPALTSCPMLMCRDLLFVLPGLNWFAKIQVLVWSSDIVPQVA